MHICFISIDYHKKQSGGGIASYVDTLAYELSEEGNDVTVVAPGNELRTEKRGGIVVMHVPLGSLHWYLYKMGAPSFAVMGIRDLEWSLALARGFRRVAKRKRVDIVEGCETGMLFLPTHKTGVPTIIRLHGAPYTFAKHSNLPISSGERFSYALELRTLRMATRITSPSRAQAIEIAKDLRWPSSRIQVIPNPIAPMILRQATRSGVPGIHGCRPTVVYTGRIEYRKGSLTLLQSIPEVAKAFPDVQYILAGGRHNSIDDRTLRNVLQDESIRSHVCILGHIDWTEIAALYQRATVFAIPSYYETFCISAVEAMAFGVPVVAANAGGIPEVVVDGVTGILFPPGDHFQLSQAITLLLGDVHIRRRMGMAGRDRVINNFTPRRVAEKTLSFYRETIQVKPRHARSASSI